MSIRPVHMAATGPGLGGSPGNSLQAADDTSNCNDRHWDDGASSGSSEYDPAAAFVTNIDEITEPFARKRKPLESNGSTESNIAKKARLAENVKNGVTSGSSPRPDMTRQLPAEIWHHIFTFLPPQTLGTVLLVNKLFHSYLDPSSCVKISPPVFSTPSTLSALKPDAIWQASRRLFWPRMPAPLKGRSEVDMWRFACSQTCQFCSRLDQAETGQAQSRWPRGPGADAVSLVFPFFIVSCGECLQKRSVKEIDLVLSSTPLFLLPSLPMVLLTLELHVIPPQVIRSGPIPPENPISKVYWPGQIEDIKAEFEAVKDLGSAAVEEWVKGLEVRGKGALADASRWEKWHLSGGVTKMRMSRSTASSTPADNSGVASTTASSAQISQSGVNKPKTRTKSQGDAERSVISSELAKSTSETSNLPPKLQSRPQGQQKRTKEEVAELKAKRRAEIEHRASQLHPPITPSVLAHIPSFQAALQIITPFDDNAWGLLKPRLLAQRGDADQREQDNMTNASTLQERQGIPQNNGAGDQQPSEVTDEEWNEVQGPLRARISGFADEIIKDGWADGKKVKRKNCTQFAAEVLLYVRKRFYAEVAKDAAAARTAGIEPIVDPPEGPWTQKLTLENMKWVFDVKVKPFTERYRKELFLCNVCMDSHKLYGFEAVIQHYAAKHTNVLSKGNVVVYWRAEWPEQPVFGTETKPTIQTSQVVEGIQHMPPVGAPFHHSHEAYGSTASTNYSSYTSPDQQHSSVPQRLGTTTTIYTPGVASHVPYGRLNASQTHKPTSPSLRSLGELTRSLYEPNEDLVDMESMMREMCPPHFQARNKPRGGYRGAPPGDPYRLRVEFMARIVKDTWGTLSNIKGIPVSVKVCTVIHHIAKDYQQQYSEPAPFDMFLDGLIDHKDFSPLHHVRGLACKSCMSSSIWSQNRRPFSFPDLADHFYDSHGRRLLRQIAPPNDWRVDMVWLPDLPALVGLRKVLRNNKPALKLVADALPWAFEIEGRGSQNEPVRDSATPAPVITDRHHRAMHTSQATATAPAPTHPGPPDTATSPSLDIPTLLPASVVYGKSDDTRHQPRYNTGTHGADRYLRANVMIGRRRTPGREDELLSHSRPSRQPITGNIDGRTLRRVDRDPYLQHGSNSAERMDNLQNGRDVRAATCIPPAMGGMREAEHRSGRAEYVNGNGYRSVTRQRSASPKPPFRYTLPAYRERSPRPTHAQASHTYEARPYSRYTNELPPHPVPPFETYEIIEVRDPQGDYFIRQPVRYDESQVFTYAERAGDTTWYPQYTPSNDQRSNRQPSILIRENRPPTAGSPEHEDYDPRYPAPAGN